MLEGLTRAERRLERARIRAERQKARSRSRNLHGGVQRTVGKVMQPSPKPSQAEPLSDEVKGRMRICRGCEHSTRGGWGCEFHKGCCFGKWRAKPESVCPEGKW